MDSEPVYALPVPRGPRAYRRRLRRFGPFAALLPAAALGGLAWLALYENSSSIRGLVGFLLAVLAAPTLLVAGAPLTAGSATYAVAVLGSAVIWFAIGSVATKRATRSPVASWGDFWREFVWLAAGVWVGVVVSLAVIDLLLGRVFL
jgi:hypothetical protein